MVEVIVKHKSQPLHRETRGRDRHTEGHSIWGRAVMGSPHSPTPPQTFELHMRFVNFTGVSMHFFCEETIVSVLFCKGRAAEGWPDLRPSWHPLTLGWLRDVPVIDHSPSWLQRMRGL